MTKNWNDAVRYVSANRPWSDAEDAVALEQINNKFPLPHNISDSICDLMEEFGEDNDLPEGWWPNEGDEEDVFFQMGEL